MIIGVGVINLGGGQPGGLNWEALGERPTGAGSGSYQSWTGVRNIPATFPALQDPSAGCQMGPGGTAGFLGCQNMVCSPDSSSSPCPSPRPGCVSTGKAGLGSSSKGIVESMV